ncbi:MAG: DUF5714 domain-containing protein [Methanocorpusculum sp.]|nr:DUF5714 domain-containing protein [Methanocorpusculum sp.]
MPEKNGACLICGEPIKYLADAEKMTCSICGKEFESNACCAKNHFVCDDCHTSPAISVTKYICSNTKSKNPIEIAKEIMKSPSVHTHGPEYHIIVGASLLAAYKNAGGKVDIDSALTAVIQRGKMVPGGFCGLAGACGAGISSGIFLSAALKTNPLSEKNWALGNLLTSECLKNISEYGGPRCCKRDSFTSIKTAVKFVEKHFGIKMELPDELICEFSKQNHECLKEKCPYYQIEAVQ